LQRTIASHGVLVLFIPSTFILVTATQIVVAIGVLGTVAPHGTVRRLGGRRRRSKFRECAIHCAVLLATTSFFVGDVQGVGAHGVLLHDLAAGLGASTIDPFCPEWMVRVNAANKCFYLAFVSRDM